MTKIKYFDFTLYKNDLIHYIHLAEKHPSHYRDPHREDYHTDRIVDSFIWALSKNQFDYDKNDEDMCRIVERLIKEYGCNPDGVYSPEAHSALRNVYQYHGLNPDSAKLTDRQPQADWRASFISVKKALSSIKENTGLSLKNFWKKRKKYVLGAFLLGASALVIKPAVNFFGSLKKQNTSEIKADSIKQSVTADTVSWTKAAKTAKVSSGQTGQAKSDTIKKILKNKTTYQSNLSAKQGTKLVLAQSNKTQQTSPQVHGENLTSVLAENMEKACNRAPTLVINDLQGKGILPANYRQSTLKEYRATHPKSLVSEVPSRILLKDIQKIYAKSSKGDVQELSDYINANQKRFLSAMKTYQKKTASRYGQIKNLQQLRDLHNR